MSPATELPATFVVDQTRLRENLRGLIGIPSPPEDERASLRYLARLFADEGLLIDQFTAETDELRAFPTFAPAPRSQYPTVIAVRPGTGGGGRSLILHAHVDTLPLDPVGWTRDPYAGDADGDRVYGLGVLSTRAACIGMVALVRALRQAGARLRGDLICQVVSDGVQTTNGSLAAATRGYAADGAVALTADADGLALGHVGHLAFQLVVYGKPAPAAREWFGISAIVKARHLAGALSARIAQGTEYSPPRLAITGIAGGEWLGNVPNKCVVQCHLIFERPATAGGMRRLVERSVEAIAREDDWLAQHSPSVRWEGMVLEPTSTSQSPLAALLLAQRRGDGAVEAEGGVSDGCIPLAALALQAPDVVAISSGEGGNLHGADEYLMLPTLLSAIDSLARSVVEWCGHAE